MRVVDFLEIPEQVHNKDCMHAASNTMPDCVNTFHFTKGTYNLHYARLLLLFSICPEFIHLLATPVVEQYSSV